MRGTGVKASVSIIVPVYNAALFLEQCLGSLITQSLNNIEIILVDDGSTDASGAICDAYATKDSRIQVIHQKNKGQTAARNAGLAASSGEYVHFVDSDDWIDPDMEKVMYEQAISNNADIVTCDTIFHKGRKEITARQAFDAGVYDKDGLVKHIYPKMIYSGRFFYFGIYAAMWNKLFRRELVTPHIINVDPAVRIGEDGLTTFASFMEASKVVIIKDTLYHYRDDNATSLTRSYCFEQFDSSLLLIAYLRRIAKQYLDVYDLSHQIDIYLLYNVKSIIVEEFYYRTKRTYRHRYDYLRRIVTHPTVQEACQRVDYKHEFNHQHAHFFELLESGRFHRLLSTTVRRSIDQRLRHYVRRAVFSSSASSATYSSLTQMKQLMSLAGKVKLFIHLSLVTLGYSLSFVDVI